MIDGDDRASFLRGQPASLLYWWHFFNSYNLLFRTVAILDDNTGTTSDRRPDAINRKNKRPKTGGDNDEANDAKLVRAQQKMSESVEASAIQLTKIREDGLLQQKTSLEREKFSVEMQKLNYADNPTALATINRRIEGIDERINQIDRRLGLGAGTTSSDSSLS